MCAHTPHSQDGFCCKGLWVEHPLTSLLFDLQGAFLCICGQGGLLTWKMRNMWSGQDPASSLNCLAVLILEFLSTGNEPPVALPCRGVGCISVLPHLHYQPSGPIQSGVCMLVVSLNFTSGTWVRHWVWHLQNQSRTWLRILSMALKEELKVLDFALWPNYCSFIFLNCFPLFLHFLTSLIEFALWSSGGKA